MPESDILMFRNRKGAVMRRAAYCTGCCSFFCVQDVPYGKEWSMLQRMDWAQDCDRHRKLCAEHFATHAYRDALQPAPTGAATAEKPASPPAPDKGVGA